ncbi:hypothetical protein CWI49_00875 [Neisseria meningitidis]|nr:hypothetical protein CWI49_00875 [Neisseria meningitidis]
MKFCHSCKIENRNRNPKSAIPSKTKNQNQKPKIPHSRAGGELSFLGREIILPLYKSDAADGAISV